MKIVLDTNIIVSAFLNPQGLPGEILSLILTKKLIVCYDNKILSEYNQQPRPKGRDIVNDLLEFYKNKYDFNKIIYIQTGRQKTFWRIL